MRVFSVSDDGSFTEYDELPFDAQHEEADLERWLEANPDGMLEEPILIIGRQVQTDLGLIIDLLGIDRRGNVVVVELKRGRTPRDVIAQALEYAAYAAQLDVDTLDGIFRDYQPENLLNLASHHREYFGLEVEAAFNKDQRIVIVGQQVTRAVKQTALFLGAKGIDVTCVEFAFFRATDGGRLLSHEVVVRPVPAKSRAVYSGTGRRVSQSEFLQACNEYGKAVFPRILDLEGRKSISIHSNPTSFSVGVDVDGTIVYICRAYLPDNRRGGGKHSIYTSLHDSTGIQKTVAPAAIVRQLQVAAEETGLFERAGNELKCIVDRVFSDEETDKLVAWCESVSDAIAEYGLKTAPDP